MPIILPDKKIVVDYENLNEINLPLNEYFILVVFKNNVKYDFVINFKENSEKLLVLGSGLIPREKIPKLNPYYNRVSWDFKYSTIFYNDPTSYVHPNIYGAWGIGTKEDWYLENIADIIKKIADNLFEYPSPIKYNNVIFIGSSQGGFMSFMLSVLVKNSLSICDIPQIDLFNGYHTSDSPPYHIYKKSILDYIFNSHDIDDLYSKFGYRFNFIELIKKEQYIPKAFLCLDCSVNLDFEQEYINFFKHLNQLPFKDEFSNNIRIRIDGKNIGHHNMSKNKLMETIENVIVMEYLEEHAPHYKNNIKYNVFNNAVNNNELIIFYGLKNVNFDNLMISINNDYIPFTDLKKSFSDKLGIFYEFPASLLGIGIHKIALVSDGNCSNFTYIFVKNVKNILDYNLWSGTEYSGELTGINSGYGQLIESSNEWSFLGERSLKITYVGDSYRWTDVPINISNFKEGCIIVDGVIKSNSKSSIFFVFTDVRGNQTFSEAMVFDKSDEIKRLFIDSIIDKEVKDISLRIWVGGELGSSIFIDNLNVFLENK